MANPIRLNAIKGLKAGDTFRIERRFTKEETLAFGRMTRDYNPVHYDERWSDAKGFKGLICHGLLVGSMVCEFGGQVGWLASGMRFNFIRPVFFNDTIVCRITIAKIAKNGRAEAQAEFTNQNGEQVGIATLTGRLPVEKERALLDEMVNEGDPTNAISNETYPLNDPTFSG